jgi:hypothetical protein
MEIKAGNRPGTASPPLVKGGKIHVKSPYFHEEGRRRMEMGLFCHAIAAVSPGEERSNPKRLAVFPRPPAVVGTKSPRQRSEKTLK